MSRKKWCLILSMALLAGCLRTIRNQLQDCTDEAKSRYASEKVTPMGQPFKDILACMHDAGYALEYDTLNCKDKDYTSMVAEPLCYRPTGVLGGYFHDVSMFFR